MIHTNWENPKPMKTQAASMGYILLQETLCHSATNYEAWN